MFNYFWTRASLYNVRPVQSCTTHRWWCWNIKLPFCSLVCSRTQDLKRTFQTRSSHWITVLCPTDPSHFGPRPLLLSPSLPNAQCRRRMRIRGVFTWRKRRKLRRRCSNEQPVRQTMTKQHEQRTNEEHVATRRMTEAGGRAILWWSIKTTIKEQ